MVNFNRGFGIMVVGFPVNGSMVNQVRQQVLQNAKVNELVNGAQFTPQAQPQPVANNVVVYYPKGGHKAHKAAKHAHKAEKKALKEMKKDAKEIEHLQHKQEKHIAKVNHYAHQIQKIANKHQPVLQIVHHHKV